MIVQLRSFLGGHETLTYSLNQNVCVEIVHRDLNLENILLEENKELDQMKIIDFGLATKYEDGVKLTELVGKGEEFMVLKLRAAVDGSLILTLLVLKHSSLRCS